MTLIDQVFEHIREHPTDTPTQIGKALGIERNHVSAYIIKLRDKGYISSFYDNGVKTYKILKLKETGLEKSLKLKEQAEFKKSIYEKMLNAYVDDFERASSFSERVEVGKLILRLLEKI